jgi:hypothetical protein
MRSANARCTSSRPRAGTRTYLPSLPIGNYRQAPRFTGRKRRLWTDPLVYGFKWVAAAGVNRRTFSSLVPSLREWSLFLSPDLEPHQSTIAKVLLIHCSNVLQVSKVQPPQLPALPKVEEGRGLIPCERYVCGSQICPELIAFRYSAPHNPSNGP